MSVARIYAKAFFESKNDVGASQADHKALGEFITDLKESREAKAVLFGPAVSTKDKISILDQLAQRAGLSKGLSHFLFLLAKKGRLSLLEEIHEHLDEVRVESEGGVLGNLVSAEPLGKKELEDLASAFSKKLNKKVEFKVSTDPTLVAGLKVTISGVTFDGSLQGQIKKLRERFVYGGSMANGN
jgi:F-type H+-transporting ATPase subunit delta